MSYGVDALRQVTLSSANVEYTSGLTLFGHATSAAEDIGLVAVFGIIMIILAVWSFGTQE